MSDDFADWVLKEAAEDFDGDPQWTCEGCGMPQIILGTQGEGIDEGTRAYINAAFCGNCRIYGLPPGPWPISHADFIAARRRWLRLTADDRRPLPHYRQATVYDRDDWTNNQAGQAGSDHESNSAPREGE